MSRTSQRNDDQEPLVSISEASRILGVSEPALRQWTDEGKIKAFLTPGGHRRYAVPQLKKFMSVHQKTAGIRDLVGTLEDTAPTHRELSQAFLQNAAWFGKLRPESQEHLASLSRRFFRLIIRYVAEPARRDETSRLVSEAGGDFGETLAGLGLSLTGSIQAFIIHRDPVMRAVTDLLKSRASNDRVSASIPLIDRVLDEALLALVEAYQHAKERGVPD
ncbi:MAG: MerR family DNA-binding transcriptional regulator [Chloroflexi bacterium]|nr:MerR family DNA-binding transcriptional regulator [Chloroflexota bacterium]